MPKKLDPLDHVIRPIVRGQIRCFIAAHPAILTGVDWVERDAERAHALTASLTKRIANDLLCPTTRARLGAALEHSAADSI